MPCRALQPLGLVRALGLSAGLVYAKLRVQHAFGIRRDYVRMMRGPIRSVLFVCHGNIIRSPMAAAMLRHYLPQGYSHMVTISSAGLYAMPTNRADLRAIEVAREFGISLDDHRAQPVTRELVDRYDVILVMDYLNEATLLARYPEAWQKVYMLAACLSGKRPNEVEIQDPYSGDIADIRRCSEILHSCVCTLAGAFTVSHGQAQECAIPHDDSSIASTEQGSLRNRSIADQATQRPR